MSRLQSIRERLARLGALARGLLNDRAGSVAMIYALSLIPLTIAAGVGVDYARAIVVRTNMSEAIDAAALAVGAQQGLSANQMQTLAQNYFNANYKSDASYGTPATLTISQSNNTITISVSDSMPTTLLNIVGIHSVNIGSSTTVVWGQLKLWVALVLDNTGSMTETDRTGTSKISALKTASSQLLTMLQGASTNAGDVQVAIVPFTKDVNIGTANKNASWIDWGIYGSCNISGIYDQPDCVSTHGTWTGGFGGFGWGFGWGGSSGSCNISGYNSQSSCENAVGTWTYSSKNSWDGCITDRGDYAAPSPQNYDEKNTTPTSSDTDTYFTAENYSDCPEQIMPLNYNWTNLNSEITNMYAGGNTNQTIGFALGWQALTQGNPFNPPALPANTNQVIILLSDGLNTQNRWTTSQSSIDAREEAACDNAKAAGIIIYTIFVDLNGTQGSSSALQYCASDPSKYFDLTTSGAIVSAFNQIGTQITNLRVSQ